MSARALAAISIAVVVPLGFGLKYYPGPGRAWVNNSLAGAAYELFWCLALFFVRPARRAILPIVAVVFAVTCALETLQLWKHPVLERIRATFPGRALIGTSFAASDFIYYVIGCALAWAWLHAIARGRPHHDGRRNPS